MAIEIVGREEELATLQTFVQHPVGGLAALVLCGEAGIGKTTLWLAGVEAARERGFRVLTARPVEAEQQLALTGLADLLDGVVEDVLPELTAPQRRALEVALLIEDADEQVSDPRALGVALRSTLRFLAGRGPLVVAIDDVQWLDRSSANALEFALRRLEDVSLSLLLARRGAGRSIERVLDQGVSASVPVGPLSVGAIHGLLRARLRRTFARPTLVRLHDASGGNPFYALELARALERRGKATDPAAPLPVPDTLHELVRDRLAALPHETRGALLAVAALGEPTIPILQTVIPEALLVLEPAVHAGVIEVVGGAARFSHPLLASILYAEARPEERRRVHARLAEAVDEPIERAHHLALATKDPDEDTARRLEEASRLALARGTPSATAELAEHAARLTPPGDGVATARRAYAAAHAYLAAGETDRARALARDLVARAEPGVPRAEALRLLAHIESEAGGVRDAISILREALANASERPVLQASLHQTLGDLLRFTTEVRAAERHACASLELAERLGDAGLLAGALSIVALLRCNAAQPGAVELAEEAYELGRVVADPLARVTSIRRLAHVLLWSGCHDRARSLFEKIRREWSDRDEGLVFVAHWYLAIVEFRAGRWPLASEHGARALEIDRQYMMDERLAQTTLLPAALIALHRGELETAREFALEGRGHAAAMPSVLLHYEAVLGCVALWSGDAAAAAERFETAEREGRTAELVEPMMYEWRAEEVEALLQLERIDDAVAVIDAWEADARRVGRDWVLAKMSRCRGLVAAARGETSTAIRLLEAAVAEHESVGDPFGCARSLLALGIVRRRGRQKRVARETIEAALARFEQLGAAGWAETAGAELGRIGGRTRQNGLSPAEQRVAALVAEGRTNREVAAALFLGEHTVETHLTHVYAKLGVRSRTELARTLR